MAHVFTPGLKVSERAVVRRARRLPLDGEVLVQVGAEVEPDTVVARTSLPGKVFPLNLANMLQVDPEDVRGCLRVEMGTAFPKGALLAETEGLLGFFKTRIKAPLDGTLETVSDVTGQAMLREPPIPIELDAYVKGRVVEVLPAEGVVVETEATFIQGIFGLGQETRGEVVVVGQGPEQALDASALGPEHRGKVVIAGAGADRACFARAVEVGVAALVVGGFDYRDVKEILGYELGVAITGTEDLGTTLVVTEGFGDIAMARSTFELLAQHAGQVASVNGATQIRAGVIRPELVIPHASSRGAPPADAEGTGLDVGSPVRGIRHPYFGRIGTVTALPSQLQEVESGTQVRVLEVEFEDGTKAIMPRANVEAIER